MAIVVSSVSIKNQVATSITHVYTHNNSIIKTLYHIINVTFTKQNFSSSNVVLIKLLFFFFLNQQFITWSTMAGHGSYFVTMYRRTETT